MKLKAPEGVGEPCVAGVAIVPRNGLYEVEAETGALLVECFGFVEAGEEAVPERLKPVTPRRNRSAAKRT